MERKGICIAGNILTDNVKMVGAYPEKGMLATITAETLAVGGCVLSVIPWERLLTFILMEILTITELV